MRAAEFLPEEPTVDTIEAGFRQINSGTSVPDLDERQKRSTFRAFEGSSSIAWIRRAAFTAVVALLAALAFAMWRRDPLQLKPRTYRTSRARLTIFGHAPYRIVANERPALDAQAAIVHIASEVERDRNPDTLHRLALAQMAAGEFDSAIQSLSETAAARPNDARALSDLAAAQIATERFVDATETAAKAVEIDPQLGAAAFNLAVALDELGIQSEATLAWERYLTIEPSGDWSDEARNAISASAKHRPTWDETQRALSTRLPQDVVNAGVARFPQSARYWIQEEVLPDWATTGNAASLAIARKVGEARALAGDPYLLDVVEHAASHQREVASGFVAFAAARRASSERRFEPAAALYADAIAALRKSGSPLALAAAIHSASNDFYRSDYDSASRRLLEVQQELQKVDGRYPGLLAELSWVRSLLLGRVGDGREIDELKAARAAAINGAESEHVLGLEALLVSNADRTGRAETVERERRNVLHGFFEHSAPGSRVATFYTRCAFTMLHLKRPRVSLAFLDAMAKMPVVLSDALLLAETEVTRALALDAIGKSIAAIETLDRSRQTGQRVKDAAMRDRVLSDADFASGMIESRSNPARATFFYTGALQTWSRHGWSNRLAKGFLARGNTHLLLEDVRSAESDYRAGIEAMERRRTTFAEPALRISYFAESGDLYEQLIGLLAGEGRTDEALDISERRRARGLLDRLSLDNDGVPMSHAAIAAALPERTALIHYAALPDRVLMWLVTPSGVAFAKSKASTAEIAAAITRHRTAIQQNDSSGVHREGSWLYQELIGPFAAQLPESWHLAVVTDGSLGSAAFAAIVGPDGRYFVEHHTVSYAPSGSTFVRDFGGLRVRNIFSTAHASGGPSDVPLPRAESDAAAIAKLYERATLTLHNDATPRAFLTSAASADVVNFAGHARHDALLFGGEDDQHALRSKEIASSSLRSHPLVVLAACNTARGPVTRNEGIDSLALAFLHSGARGVVATLWDVEDLEASRITRLFHENLRGGMTSAEALRRAQLSMLNSKESEDRAPRAWAGVILAGKG